MQQQQLRSDDFMVICPSFSSYATNGLAAIASKVADEFRCFESFPEDDDEFEFSLVLGDEHLDHHGADEVICAGQSRIRPFINPIFPDDHRELIKIDLKERDQIRGEDHDRGLSSRMTNIGIPFRELLLDDREEQYSSTSSCDSSSIMEEELMETEFSAKAHCFGRCRTPKSAGNQTSSPNRWKKSSSTGSGTKRTWKLLDMLRRSNSEGDMTSNPKNRQGKVETSKITNHSPQIKGRDYADGIGASPSRLQSLHEVFYVRNKAAKNEEGCRRKSYLPYKPNLVGIFASFNGMGRSYPF